MSAGYVCWHCGAALKALAFPIRRYTECPSCREELHVCRMCRHYDRSLRHGCLEERADPVLEPERGNFCDWFRPKRGAFGERADDRNAAARGELDKLFGAGGDNGEATAPASRSPANGDAREALDRLFGDKGDSSR